jgi:hypothetical protein
VCVCVCVCVCVHPLCRGVTRCRRRCAQVDPVSVDLVSDQQEQASLDVKHLVIQCAAAAAAAAAGPRSQVTRV